MEEGWLHSKTDVLDGRRLWAVREVRVSSVEAVGQVGQGEAMRARDMLSACPR